MNDRTLTPTEMRARLEHLAATMALNDLIVGVETAGEQAVEALRAKAGPVEIRQALASLRDLSLRLATACTDRIRQIDATIPAVTLPRPQVPR